MEMLISPESNRFLWRTNTSIYNIKPEHINIEMVAHGLSNINRYAGNLKVHYTVADHSIYMAWRFIDKKEYHNALMALVHDMAEIVTGDISSFIKKEIPELKEIEAHIFGVMCKALNLPNEIPQAVDSFDKELVEIELSQFEFGDLDEKTPRIKLYGNAGKEVFLDMYKFLRDKK